jgi:DGQHR domain-containing protein
MAGLSVNAVVMKQKAETLYLFVMNSENLSHIAYVTPRSHDNPTEIQRIVRKSHYEDIVRYIKEEGTLLPTAIVVGLEPEVQAIMGGDGRTAVLQFPDEEGKHAYVLDGQHRLRALQQPGVPQLDLPVVALYGASEATRAKVFADINSKQEQVQDVLLLGLYRQIGDLTPDESALVDVVYALGGDDDSPLKGKVQILPDDKGTWIRSPILKRFVKRALVGTSLENAPAVRRASVLKEYLKAISALWPEAWADRKEYVLTGSAGLEITLGAFSAAKDRVDLNAGAAYTQANFREQMKPLVGAVLDVDVGGTTVPLTLDWKKEPLTSLSRGQKGRETVIARLKRALFEEDQT